MLPNPALKMLLAHQGLKVERSRCVQHRYKPTDCDRCFKICPSGAIRWTDDGLHWEESDCQRCLLCVAVCPTGALVARELPFVHTLKKLAAEDRPVLACSGRPSTVGHARLHCLGLLCNPELLLASSLALGRPFQLNLTECRECPNAVMLPYLKISAEQVSESVAHAQLIEQTTDLDYHEKSVSRREFFSLLRRQSKVAAHSLADALQEMPDRSFGDKALPARRMLLLQLLKRLSDDQRVDLTGRLFPTIDFSGDECTGCTGCVGLCPTGAMLPPAMQGQPPKAHVQNCTECDLCTAFCSSDAIRIKPGKLGLMAMEIISAST